MSANQKKNRWLSRAALQVPSAAGEAHTRPIAKARQLAQQQAEYLLDEVGGIAFLKSQPAGPLKEQGGIKAGETVPRRGVLGAAEPFEQAGGSGVHRAVLAIYSK